jgi:tetratricopeptide (TPR) repeat protein
LVLGLTALLTVNSLYLSAVTFYEWLMDKAIQDEFYLWMFLAHLVLGLLLIVPLVIYAIIHAVNTRSYNNKTAKRAGYLMLISALVLLITGVLLTRFDAGFEALNSQHRSVIYWLHVLLPIVCFWLFVLHRLMGRAINLKPGKWIISMTVLGVLGYLVFQQSNEIVPTDNKHFSPTFATTSTGGFIPAEQLNNDPFCVSCHEDFHQQWMSSAHHFSSFNNQAYAFAVNNTKDTLNEREGHADAARLCASCHDPVLLFSGQFDDLTKAEQTSDDAMAGITCSACHLIDEINSHKGNGAYQMSTPVEYPLTQSDELSLQWINRVLIKSKPELHKTTYLKPIHQTAEFCSTCHKVSLPKELNDYRWLRGQNHYDSFLLSGVSGHKVTSFYYPKKAKEACQDCHMVATPSTDIAAQYDATTDNRYISNHAFDVANTAIRYLNDQPLNQDSSALLKQSVGIDLIGIKDMAKDQQLQLNKGQPLTVEPGQSYLLDAVLKTKTLGHAFTQGTADSNQIWLELAVYQGDQLIASSGGINAAGELDPYAYKVNAYVIDRDGNQIMMRNAEDIFTMLYNHQIPPGAAAVIHYQVDVPADLTGKLRVEAKLYYRKFNTTFYRAFMNNPDSVNDLPVVLISEQQLELQADQTDDNQPESLAWQRWNDYGIALLRAEEYKQATYAFEQVVAAGRSEGLVNLLRVHLQEGQLEQAQKRLAAAQADGQFPYPWQLDYFAGKLHFLNGRIDQAITAFHHVLDSDYPQARQAGFDFSQDYEFLTELAQAYLQMALMDPQQQNWIDQAQQMYNNILAINSEWAAAYYGLFRVAKMQGDDKTADDMQKQYQYYKLDDQIKDRAINAARIKDPAADKAANRVVIYSTQSSEAYPMTLKQYQATTDIIIL